MKNKDSSVMSLTSRLADVIVEKKVLEKNLIKKDCIIETIEKEKKDLLEEIKSYKVIIRNQSEEQIAVISALQTAHAENTKLYQLEINKLRDQVKECDANLKEVKLEKNTAEQLSLEYLKEKNKLSEDLEKTQGLCSKLLAENKGIAKKLNELQNDHVNYLKKIRRHMRIHHHERRWWLI